MKCAVDHVIHEGVEGKFRGNAEHVGWQSVGGERSRVLDTATVKRAEWFEGKLRLLTEGEEGGNSQVLALEGFSPEDYDTLWRYFEQSCGVFIKRHTRVAALDETDFDLAARAIEAAADRVDDAAEGSVQKKAKEADLMKKVENVRDGLELAVGGDKQALSRVFAANGCERIGRLRLVVDTVQLEVYQTDPRWKHLINRAASIESVLRELGTFRQWRPKADDTSLVRRQMVRELRMRQGEDDLPNEQGSAPPLVDPVCQAQQQPAALQPERLAGLGPVDQLPLGGFRPPARQPDPAADAERPETQHPPPACPATSSTRRAGGSSDDGEEVTNPNASRADAPESRRRLRASGLGDTEDSRARQTHPGSLQEGWVWKRSRFLKRWRRRWLVLMPERLMSFKKKNDREATEVIERGTVMRVYSAEHEVNQTKAFCVMQAKRSFHMVCDDEEQKAAWIREVQKALGSTYR